MDCIIYVSLISEQWSILCLFPYAIRKPASAICISEKQRGIPAAYLCSHRAFVVCCLKSMITVKFLNFGMPEIFAVIYLKFKQRGQTLRYCVKIM